MDKIIYQSDINDFTEEIIKNHKNVYVVDFEKDIYIDKSDYYELNEEENCLTFLYQEIKELKPEDFYVVTGAIQPMKDGFKLASLSDPKNMATEQQRALVISKDPIVLNTNDSLYIAYERNVNTIYMSLVSKYFYEQTMRLHNKEINFEEWLATTQTRNESIRIINELHKNRFVFYEKKGNQQATPDNISIFNNQQELKYLINFAERYILMSNRKKHILLNNTNQNTNQNINDLYYLCFIYHPSVELNKANIKNLKLTKSQGYVYLKQIENFGNRESRKKIIMFFSGDVKLQYYLDKKDLWEQIEDTMIEVKDVLQLRLAMSSGSKVYKLIVYEDI
ncbi:MAG: hypothetical protein GX327_09730 [Epulopiscium sp.]|nr:hypothetical protein [Candidatus Epulonipiscium sp.]